MVSKRAITPICKPFTLTSWDIQVGFFPFTEATLVEAPGCCLGIPMCLVCYVFLSKWL